MKEIKISDFLKTNINKVIDIGGVDNHLQFISITNVLCLLVTEGFGSIIIDAAAIIPSLVTIFQDCGIQFIITRQASYQKIDIHSFSEYHRCMLITNLERKWGSTHMTMLLKILALRSCPSIIVSFTIA